MEQRIIFANIGWMISYNSQKQWVWEYDENTKLEIDKQIAAIATF